MLNWMLWTTHETHPSFFIDGMKERGQLPAGLAALVGCQQEVEWHPEGDAYRHTLHVCDAMAEICEREGAVGFRRRMLMFAALTHDFGKATTTVLKEKDGVSRWVSPGHDEAGVPLALAFLEGVGAAPALLERVPKLVRWHMTHCRRDGWSDRSVKKLARNLFPATIRDLLLVMEADCNGRPPAPRGLPKNVDGLVKAAGRLAVMDGPPGI